MTPSPYRVEEVRAETSDTLTLVIRPELDRSAPAFAPGQFNMLYAFGVGEVAISLSGDPTDPGLRVHTIRAVGPVTRALCALEPGAALGVRGPFGSAWPVEAAVGHDLIIVAGGIGLAPLRPAILSVLSRRERFGRVAILYGARSPEDLLYIDELRDWRGRLDLEVEVTVDHAPDRWRGHVGVVTQLVPFVPFDLTDAFGLVCGPEIMMRFAARELRSRGLPAERLYLSMERNMKCGIGQCGHCQFGPSFVCKDGPVFELNRIESLMRVREL